MGIGSLSLFLSGTVSQCWGFQNQHSPFLLLTFMRFPLRLILFTIIFSPDELGFQCHQSPSNAWSLIFNMILRNRAHCLPTRSPAILAIEFVWAGCWKCRGGMLNILIIHTQQSVKQKNAPALAAVLCCSK